MEEPFNFSRPMDNYITCGRCKKLEYMPSKVIGEGSNSTTVYEGRFETIPVAVKQIRWDNFKGITAKALKKEPREEDINEAKILRQYEHENVIRYYLLDHDDRGFIYLALELCKGNLAEFLEFGKPDKLPEDISREVVKKHLLKGMLEGLHYLHGVGIIHNDLKPQNILLKESRIYTHYKFIAVISDFGMSLVIDDGRNSKTAIENLIGTKGWRPKEVVNRLEELSKQNYRPSMTADERTPENEGGKIKGTKKVDIFAFGCIIQYVMVENTRRGRIWKMHPFGDENVREDKIKSDSRVAYISRVMSPKNLKLDYILADMLVGLCINEEPQCRPNTEEIKNHPFFWESNSRYKFVEISANKLKGINFQDDNKDLLTNLQKIWQEFHPWSYEQEIKDAVTYRREYHSSINSKQRGQKPFNEDKLFEVVDLLKDIRNIKQHFHEIDAKYDIASFLGEGTDEDFDRYFIQKILQLLPVLYTWCLYDVPREKMGVYNDFISRTEDQTKIDLRKKVYWRTLEKILSWPGTAGGQNPKKKSRKRPPGQSP
ncbi:hypothetical protein ACHWQZ_G017886 [Mnemiopsis leidyi]